jgi:DNA-binding LacI/PurR family transcriptional regulator
MQNGTGRASAELTAHLRGRIAAGEIPAGQFLPPERTLSMQHGVARKTVRRAVRTLEDEGLIATVPRRGYRVLARANDPDRGAPVAYMFSTQKSEEALTLRYRVQIESFQQAAGGRGWSMLLITAQNRTHAQMLEQARAAQTSGMVLDTEQPELIRPVVESGLPAVIVDAWRPEFSLDSVMQDGQHAGMLAAEYLASRGHQRIAWVGPRITDAHSADRYGGSVAGLARAGLDLTPDRRIITSDEQARRKIREVLSRSDRPTAFIALWSGLAIETVRVARDLGLEYGKDYEVVGWSVEELYEDQYVAGFEGGPVPPAITWSMRTMAETAITRLAERRANPNAPVLRVKIPTTLRG